MASGEGQSNPSTSEDAGRDHNKDHGNEYGPPLPTQEELREMEHRRLVGEATIMMLNFATDPKLAKYMTETAFQDVHAQWKATTTSPPKPDSKKQYSEKDLEEEQLSSWAEDEGVPAMGQARFRRGFSTLDHILTLKAIIEEGRSHGRRRGFSTLDHILTLKAIIEEGRSHGRRIYCSFVDFHKAFSMVPRAGLMRRLQEMGVPTVSIWVIKALYRSVMVHVRTLEEISDLVHSTIGVKQGCLLSPTLFGMYINEVSD
ncbi:hypothetical protein L7F22_025838 [Adiantum nelumboides]|nr:hypothetical protein [Adiantum nelumboides]